MKDALGPSFAGSPSWRMQLTVIETKLRDYGAVDIKRNPRTYNRWTTTEWPDDSHWTLVSNGKTVKVASYGANSGSTPEQGTTADLIYYDPANPPASIAGKIVVYLTIPEDEHTPLDKRMHIWPGDYMFLSNPETFPDPRIPRKLSMQAHLRSEMGQANAFRQQLIEGKAAGAVFVFQAGYERVAGLYTFGVPPIYQCPTLYLDRTAGKQVIEDAKQGKSATLRLISKVEPTETYQLFAYLPGRIPLIDDVVPKEHSLCFPSAGALDYLTAPRTVSASASTAVILATRIRPSSILPSTLTRRLANTASSSSC